MVKASKRRRHASEKCRGDRDIARVAIKHPAPMLADAVVTYGDCCKEGVIIAHLWADNRL